MRGIKRIKAKVRMSADPKSPLLPHDKFDQLKNNEIISC